MKLSEIPEDKLKEIEAFLKENKGKYPVTTSPGGKSAVKTLPELVKEKFGVELSPAQIYTLMRGQKTVRIKVDVEALRQLEEAYGDVSKGIKEVLKIVKGSQAPAYLKPAVQTLADMTEKQGGLTYADVVKTLADLKYSDPDGVLRELFRLGYGENAGGRYRFYRVAIPGPLRILLMLR